MGWKRSRRLIGILLTIVVVAGLGAPAEAVESGHVRGTVSVPKNVKFVLLEAYLYRKVDGRWLLARKHPAKVDHRGRFAAGGLRTGTYRLYISDETDNTLAEYYDNHRTFSESTTFRVRRGHVTRLRPVRLTRAAHIRGRLTTMSGRPIPSASVSAVQKRDGEWRVAQRGSITSDGRYDVPGLRTGTYRLSITDATRTYAGEFWPNAPSAESATSIRVRTGHDVKHKDARLERGARISGIVTADDGKPFFDEESVAAFQWDGIDWRFASGTVVSASGAYTLKGLAAGTYRPRFRNLWNGYAEEFWDDATAMSRATDIVVPGASRVTGKDAVIARTIDLDGRVESGAGAPLANITVTAHRPVPGAPGQWEVAATMSTWAEKNARQANFRFYLAPGTYRLTFTDPAGIHAPLPLESASDIMVTAHEPGWPPVTPLQPVVPPW